MVSAGSLSVSLNHGGIGVFLSRENLAQRLCEGQSIEEAEQRIEQTYLICRHAQRTAARLAMKGLSPTPPELRAVSLEIIEQTLWRWWVDWPQSVLSENHIQTFAEVRKPIARFQKRQVHADDPEALFRLITVLDSSLLALMKCTSQEFSAKTALELYDWLQFSNSTAARILRSVSGGSTAELIGNSCNIQDLAALEEIEQFNPEQTYFTSALAEYRSDPRIVRLQGKLSSLQLLLIARLLLLSDQIQQLPHPQGAESFGVIAEHTERLSWVLTGRGLLVHRVSLNSRLNRVRKYRVYAPTDLNFASDRLINLLLENPDLSQVNQLYDDLLCCVLALDPCVTFNVEVSHA